MTQQPDLFTQREGERRRDAGREASAGKGADILDKARRLARTIAQAAKDHCVTADEVFAALIEIGYKPEELGNAAGSLFRGKEWQFSGQWRKSTRVTNHARYIMIWRLKDGA